MTHQQSTGRHRQAKHDHDGSASDINTKPVEKADSGASEDDPSGEVGGLQISEAGGASLNEEANAGGADAVPDTHG